jgi:hypothetical protein
MNDALIRFHDEYCPELSYDDPKLTFLLIEKINELKEVSVDDKRRYNSK